MVIKILANLIFAFSGMDSAVYFCACTVFHRVLLRRNVIMNLSTLHEVPQTNQEPFSACEVEVGPVRLKVWHKSPTYLCLLAGQDPSNLIEFREGEMLTLAYHDSGSSLPSEHLKTAVRRIKRNERGKLKGQYLVDLEILKSYH
jgi:hypothetical protein